MTIAEIEDRITEIQKLSDYDPESAHSMEDALMRDFIEYSSSARIIMSGRGMLEFLTEITRMAKLISSTKEIEFPRWCA
jgi:hypothetical protein